MKLELQATPQEVMRAVQTLEKFARERQASDRAVFHLALALEECGSNIVNHALHRDANRTFRVAFEQADDSIVIELRDHGPEFDPTAAMAAQVQTEPDVPGGWGLQLVRRYMDEIHYCRQGQENVVRLTKHLKSPAET